MSTRAKTTLSALAMLMVGLVVPASAHDTFTPNLACTPQQAMHDIVGEGSLDATALGEASGAGATIVFESSLDCPLVPLICEDDILVDDGGTPEDPSDDIVIPCDPNGLGTPLVPGSDGDSEWGIGGALLPDDHHTGDAGTVAWKHCDEWSSTGGTKSGKGCSWGDAAVGRDGDDDGFVDGGNDPTDCLTDPIGPNNGGSGLLDVAWFEGQVFDATDGRLCDAAGAAGTADAGTWIFTSGQVITGDDGSTGPDDCDGDGQPDTGPLLIIDLRILGEDTDGDGLPGEDTDGDGVPEGATNPEWGPEDLLTVNPDWCPPAVNPPTTASPSAQIALVGHAW